ncbi:MAG TPA: L,D-transpeptidase family protein [Rhodospirillales bacterium]|nr:L,D-transpeptidase family protein [Rhodospirillales bacterium]
MIMAVLLSLLLLVGVPLPASASPVGSGTYVGAADRVLVVKSERMLYLLRDDQVIASYRVALGRSPIGHKVFQGDGRTPEGLYELDRRNLGSQFYRSIRISYPSARDYAEARKYGEQPGGLVMIHGQSGNSGTGYYGSRRWDWTEGCIAVSNAEMDQIWAATDEGTPIEILP